MTDNRGNLGTMDIRELANELTYQRYLMNKEQIQGLFSELNIPEYLALHVIESRGAASEENSGRTYLKELAVKMQLTIQQASKIVGGLEDRGLLTWSHDGYGSEGTYMIITESGRKLVLKQEKRLKEYYGTVFEKFGRENLMQLLALMKQLEEIMDSSFGEKD